jgi:predicted nucleic acid-binding protein
MIAADTSTWIAFFSGTGGKDVGVLDKSLADRQVLMPPVVLTELMSDPALPKQVAQLLLQIPLVELSADYWHNAGTLRAKVLARGRKARLGDALVAQNCIDGAIPLLTRDRDFRAFVDLAGLQVLP